MGENWGEGFYGEPFEALGNVNDAIYPGGAAKLVEKLSGYMEDAYLVKNRAIKEGDMATLLFLYPGVSKIRLGMLIANMPPENKPVVISLYPVMEGIENNLEVINFKAWANELEGMVSGETDSFGLFAFFDPFYFWDQWHLQIGQQTTFNLSALAFSVAIALNEEFEITQGPLYEMSLEEFLAEHPDKTREDFPNPKLIMGSAQMLLSTPYTGEYHYRALILAREELEFLGEKFWRYHLSLVIEDDQPSPEIWLYAANHVIKGREPKVGDYIEGVCWMSGYLPFDKNQE